MQIRRTHVLTVMALASLVAGGAVAQETTEPPDAAEAAAAPVPESAAPASLTFETTVDFALLKSVTLEGQAGEIEFRGVEFTGAATKGGVFGTSDADLRTTVTAILTCSTQAEKKAKVDLTIQFLDGEGQLIDRITESVSLKAGAKPVQVKLTTLKYVVPLIKTAKITAVAKAKN